MAEWKQITEASLYELSDKGDSEYWFWSPKLKMVEQGRYSWRQGWNPHRLHLNGYGDCNALAGIWTHYAPIIKPEPPADGVPAQCWCHTCRPLGLDRMEMILCPDCGNKRCPKANDHRNACTNSNEPGQPGSAYPSGVALPGPVTTDLPDEGFGRVFQPSGATNGVAVVHGQPSRPNTSEAQE